MAILRMGYAMMNTRIKGETMENKERREHP